MIVVTKAGGLLSPATFRIVPVHVVGVPSFSTHAILWIPALDFMPAARKRISVGIGRGVRHVGE
ncbi:hypothetical protein SCANM63S_00135 [Streptomyces canarius]